MGKERLSEAQRLERQQLLGREFVAKGIRDVYAKLTSIFEVARTKSMRERGLHETKASLLEGDRETVIVVEPLDERLKGVILTASCVDGEKVFAVDRPTQGVTDHIGPDSGSKNEWRKEKTPLETVTGIDIPQELPLTPTDIRVLRLLTALIDIRLEKNRGKVEYTYQVSKK